MTVPAPRKQGALIYGVALCFLLAIGAVSVLVARELYVRALSETEQQASRFVSGAQAALNRSVLGVDVLLAGLGDLLPEAGSTESGITPERAAQLMEAGVSQNLLVRQLAAVTPDGSILLSSDQRESAAKLELPPGYLDKVLAEPISTLVISAPAISPSGSQPVLYFGRVLHLNSGRQVAAIAEVEIALLVTILTQGADIKGLEVTLERDTGMLLASMPSRNGTEGAQLPALTDLSNDGAPRMSTARLSRVPAVVVARPTLHREVIVTASIPLAFALAVWRHERNLIFTLAAAIACLTLAVAAFTHMRVRRQWAARTELLQSKATLDQALESMEVGFVLLDPQGRLLVWNQRFLEIFPSAHRSMGMLLPFKPVLEMPWGDRAASDGERVMASIEAHRALLGAEQGDQELALADRRVIRATKSRTPDGGAVYVYQDITEKKAYTAEVLEGKAQLQATLDALPDVLLELDLEGRCHRFHVPDGGGGVFSIPPLGRLLAELLPLDAARQVMSALLEAANVGVSKGMRFVRSLDDEVTCFEISASLKPAAVHEKPRVIVILRDITLAERATRRIEQLAFYDALTGLPNRRLLLDKMARAARMERASRQHGALLFLDLDHFKILNDALGHASGDALLKEVAVRIRAIVTESDTVARLGGDEFVVMLEDLGRHPQEAKDLVSAIAAEIIGSLNRPYKLINGVSHHSACSVGAVLFDGTEASLEDLLKQADIAMYYAKTAGGNSLRFFEPEMQIAIAHRSALENELREALVRGEFALHYQRQVAQHGEVLGAEVLVRWHHPQRGLVLPGAFIEVAEATELIVPLGLWVLEAACRQLAIWSRHPDRHGLHLAVNVSARQFRRDDFVAQIRAVLSKTGADPKRLKLELTESLLQSQVAETIEKMKTLKTLGIRFSMDDFGTGYSSLSYMTQLPLDQVKIDKFFVHGIGRDPKVEKIVQTIIGMARNLEIELIAEGVETEAQRLFLEQNGCLLWQGYLFSAPLPLDAFERTL